MPRSPTDASPGYPLPLYMATNTGNAGLAAGAEVSVVVNLALRPLPSGFAIATFAVFTGITHGFEAGVLYSTENITSGGVQNAMTIRVRNVGSVAGVSVFAVHVLVIAFFDLVN